MKSVVLSFVISFVTCGCFSFPEEDEIPFRTQLNALVPKDLLMAPFDLQWVDRGVDNLVYLQRRDPKGRSKVLETIGALSPETRIMLLKHCGQRPPLAKL